MATAQSALLIGKITHARKEWEALSSLLQLKVHFHVGPSTKYILMLTLLQEYESGTREDFISRCKKGEYDDVVVIYRSNDSTVVTGPFDKELIEALPKSLKYITHNGAGYDNIDVPAATDRNIEISSTPIAVDEATADGM